MLPRNCTPRTCRPVAQQMAALLLFTCLAGPLLAAEIHQAVQAGDLEQVQSLLAGGADPDAREPRLEFTPLHLCVYVDNLEIGEALIAAGADVNARNRMDLSPLDMAIVFSKVETAAFLITHGADIEGENGHDHRPLTYATSRGHTEIVRMLLDAGADLEAWNRQGQTALLAAIVAGRDDMVALLLSREARVDVTDPTHGRPLLHHACLTGHLHIVEQIVAAGADVNSLDTDGQTALHLATRYGHQQVAELLLTHGARRPEDLVENYDRSPHLQRELAEGEAVAWYLNHRGWAVKTRNHLLVFDAEEFGVVRPADPALANGFLSTEELSEEYLLGLYTCYHGDPGELAYVHELADQVASATYVHLADDRFRDGPSCLYLAAGDQREIDGVTVRTIDAFTGNPTHAYLVEADGLAIFYQGFGVDDPVQFRQDLDRLIESVDRVDLAFLPIPEPLSEGGGSGMGVADGESPPLDENELFFQIVAKLRPAAVCLLDPNRREALYLEVARRMTMAGFRGEVFCAEYPGDHLVYPGRLSR
ncbi:MAG: ankyrin repeat domain-containing protein [bacterium]